MPLPTPLRSPPVLWSRLGEPWVTRKVVNGGPFTHLPPLRDAVPTERLLPPFRNVPETVTRQDGGR